MTTPRPHGPASFTGPTLGADGPMVRDRWPGDANLLVRRDVGLPHLAADRASPSSLVSVRDRSGLGHHGGRLYSAAARMGLLMRTVDVLYSVPFIPLVIVLEVLFGRNFPAGVRRHRRGLLARHCPHRARPDPSPSRSAELHRGRRSHWACATAQPSSGANVIFPTSSAWSSCTPR